ncbi:MAG: ubiquinone-binding protein [Legionellales bacterium]|nr:ubiquinone-binding protein [Legionellales bacterium]|tara:strand:- start:16004 stop:16441 length:438 start_codon:yes stop_codon:yes gene_type:complete
MTTTINRKAVVPYTAQQMYNLVNDIPSYPEFLPWCESSEILSATDDEIRATLVLSKGGLQKAFTTCNRLQKDKMIEVRLVSGPFHHLEGFWRFENIDGGGSKVSLDMEFEFSNRILSMMLGPIFNQIANSFVEVFSERAKVVYGD